jgi:hypothetical protein
LSLQAYADCHPSTQGKQENWFHLPLSGGLEERKCLCPQSGISGNGGFYRALSIFDKTGD